MRSSQGCMWVPVHDQRIQQAFEVLPVGIIGYYMKGGDESVLLALQSSLIFKDSI